jgi:hypothetical protein
MHPKVKHLGAHHGQDFVVRDPVDHEIQSIIRPLWINLLTKGR